MQYKSTILKIIHDKNIRRNLLHVTYYHYIHQVSALHTVYVYGSQNQTSCDLFYGTALTEIWILSMWVYTHRQTSREGGELRGKDWCVYITQVKPCLVFYASWSTDSSRRLVSHTSTQPVLTGSGLQTGNIIKRKNFGIYRGVPMLM